MTLLNFTGTAPKLTNVQGALTLVTFGIRLPAGIFIPSLAAGALAGRVVGILLQYARYQHPNAALFKSCTREVDCIIPGLYAMVGLLLIYDILVLKRSTSGRSGR